MYDSDLDPDLDVQFLDEWSQLTLLNCMEAKATTLNRDRTGPQTDTDRTRSFSRRDVPFEGEIIAVLNGDGGE